MYTLQALLLSLPLAASIPQGFYSPDMMGCDVKTDYITAGSKDATENFGDHGWQNYDSNTCTAGGATCSLTEGKSISKTVGLTFGASGSFDLTKALGLGLDFGVSVSTTDTTSQTTSETCVASGDDNKACVCGLQFKITQQEAWGHTHSHNACGSGNPDDKDFDVTSPVLIDGKPRTQWRVCKAAASACDKMKDSPVCADGL